MKNLPASLTSKTAKPIWVVEIDLESQTYSLTADEFPGSLAVLAELGEMSEGVQGYLGEIQTTELSFTVLNDFQSTLYEELLDAEASPVRVYLADRITGEKSLFFNGTIRDPEFDSDLAVRITAQDDSIKLTNQDFGTEITSEAWPNARQSDLGKVAPFIFNAAERVPAVCVKDGAYTLVAQKKELALNEEDVDTTSPADYDVQDASRFRVGMPVIISEKYNGVVTMVDEKNNKLGLSFDSAAALFSGTPIRENTDLVFQLHDENSTSSEAPLSISKISAKVGEKYTSLEKYVQLNTPKPGFVTIDKAYITELSALTRQETSSNDSTITLRPNAQGSLNGDGSWSYTAATGFESLAPLTNARAVMCTDGSGVSWLRVASGVDRRYGQFISKAATDSSPEITFANGKPLSNVVTWKCAEAYTDSEKSSRLIPGTPKHIKLSITLEGVASRIQYRKYVRQENEEEFAGEDFTKLSDISYGQGGSDGTAAAITLNTADDYAYENGLFLTCELKHGGSYGVKTRIPSTGGTFVLYEGDIAAADGDWSSVWNLLNGVSLIAPNFPSGTAWTYVDSGSVDGDGNPIMTKVKFYDWFCELMMKVSSITAEVTYTPPQKYGEGRLTARSQKTVAKDLVPGGSIYMRGGFNGIEYGVMYRTSSPVAAQSAKSVSEFAIGDALVFDGERKLTVAECFNVLLQKAGMTVEAFEPFQEYVLNGAITEKRRVTEWLLKFAIQSACQFRRVSGVAMLIPIHPKGVISEIDMYTALKDDGAKDLKFSKTEVSELINKISAKFAKNHATGEYTETVNAADAASIAKFQEQAKDSYFEFDFIRDAATAKALVLGYLQIYSRRRVKYEWSAFLDKSGVEAGDRVKGDFSKSVLRVQEAKIQASTGTEPDGVRFVAESEILFNPATVRILDLPLRFGADFKGYSVGAEFETVPVSELVTENVRALATAESYDAGAVLKKDTVKVGELLNASSQIWRLTYPLEYCDTAVVMRAPVELELWSGPVSSGTVETVSQEDFLNGNSTAFILAPSGRWEVIAWQKRTVQRGGRRIILENILRGRQGTLAEQLPAGSFLVFAETPQAALESLGAGAVTLTVSGVAAEAVTDATVNAEITQEALRPYPVAQLRVVRVSETEILATWKRRSRAGAAGFEDPILDEASESYRVSVSRNGVTLNESTVAVPEFSYNLTDGETVTGLTFTVTQLGATLNSNPVSEVL